MPSTARQLRQPPTIKAIGRVPYFADISLAIRLRVECSREFNLNSKDIVEFVLEI